MSQIHDEMPDVPKDHNENESGSLESGRDRDSTLERDELEEIKYAWCH